MIDDLIRELSERFHLGEKAGPLAQGLLDLISDESAGGVRGFLRRFQQAAPAGAVESWLGTEENQELTAQQVEGALGRGPIAGLADRLGLDTGVVTAALAYAIPRVVDLLTPDGKVPESAAIRERLAPIPEGSGSAVGDAVDEVGPTATSAPREVEQAGRAAFDDVRETTRGGGGWLKWLIVLLVLLALIWWFTQRRETTQPAGTTEQPTAPAAATEPEPGEQLPETEAGTIDTTDEGTSPAAEEPAATETGEGVDAGPTEQTPSGSEESPQPESGP